MNRIALVLMLALAACRTTPKIPENVLKPDRMTAIMYDMIQADGYISNTPVEDTVARTTKGRIKVYQQVLVMHGTTKDEFTRSLQYYEERPSLLKLVLDSMEQRASRPLPDAPAYLKREPAAN